jgi:hypothetical protein
MKAAPKKNECRQFVPPKRLGTTNVTSGKKNGCRGIGCRKERPGVDKVIDVAIVKG